MVRILLTRFCKDTGEISITKEKFSFRDVTYKPYSSYNYFIDEEGVVYLENDSHLTKSLMKYKDGKFLYIKSAKSSLLGEYTYTIVFEKK